MKTWFVYLINGKKIGTWANNTDEAERNLRKEFGDIPMEFVGIHYDRQLGPQPDKVVYTGMSAVDIMIASGGLKWLSALA